MKPAIYDFLGIGAGPANLAVSVAWHEAVGVESRAMLLEKSETLRWHDGMQIDDARLQVSPLKDLVMQRNPRSRFTFINYLKSHGRLGDFINLGMRAPSRVEFRDYLRWVHDELGQTRFGLKAHEVSFDDPDGKSGIFRVQVEDRNGKEDVIRTRHLSLALGMQVSLPKSVPSDHPAIIHSSRFVPAMEVDFPDPKAAYKFLVVGDGQSAGEILLNLLRRYPNAHITVAGKRFLFRAVDDNPLVNHLYTDSDSMNFNSLSEDSRASISENLRSTNYGVVDNDVIEGIAQQLYTDRVNGRDRLLRLSYHELVGIQAANVGIAASLRNLVQDDLVSVNADAAIMATGYSIPSNRSLFGPIADRLIWRTAECVSLDKDFRAKFQPGSDGSLFIHGTAMQTHGLAEGTLTNLAEKAGRIVDRMLNDGSQTSACEAHQKVKVHENHQHTG